jgi:uridine kinase
MKILLIGFMGAGKSFLGRMLADEFALDFFDTDEAVCRESGKTISDFYEQKSWEDFRAIESKVLLDSPQLTVISTGGGVVLSEVNRAFLKDSDSFVIWLKPDFELVLDRIIDSDRPLVKLLDKESIRKLYNERLEYYAECADLIYEGNSAEELYKLLKKEVKMMSINVTISTKIGDTIELMIEEPKRIYEILQMAGLESSLFLSYKLNKTAYVDERKVIYKDTLIECVRYCHPEGRWIYQDTAIFIMSKAFHNLFPNSSFVVEHSISNAVYCEVFDKPDGFQAEDADALRKEMHKIVNRSMDIEAHQVPLKEVEMILHDLNRKDFLKNLEYFSPREVKMYKCGSYYDYYLRTLADNTRVMDKFNIMHKDAGFLLVFEKCSDKPYSFPQKLFRTHQEHDKWLNILKVHNIRDLNKLIDSYDISNFILVEEALHEKKIALIADEITKDPKTRIVLIAGPSSSGKTTFAKRLGVQIRVCGFSPIVISMDDYFLPRTKTPKKEDGSYDFECIESLDLPLLNDHLQKLLDGQEIELPKYNFSAGSSERSFHKVKMGPNNLIVMEGIHGINDKLTASIPDESKVKIYISALNQLNIDDHNRIPTTDCRKIRRLVRDKLYRGYSAEDTLSRWEDVREGEDKNIFPYQENADFMFNSSLTYELAVLKKYAYKQLKNVPAQSSEYTEAQRLLELLSFFKDIPEEIVPADSLLKEFISGSVFSD